MPSVSLTGHLRRHCEMPTETCETGGKTVSEVLSQFFGEWPGPRGYVLDDRGAVRNHVTIFVNNVAIRDRLGLSDPVKDDDEIFIMQALSGG